MGSDHHTSGTDYTVFITLPGTLAKSHDLSGTQDQAGGDDPVVASRVDSSSRFLSRSLHNTTWVTCRLPWQGSYGGDERHVEANEK